MLAHPGVDCATVSALNPAEIADTTAGAALYLSSDDLQTIDRIVRTAVPVGDPSPEGTFTTDVREHVEHVEQSSRDAPAARPRETRGASRGWTRSAYREQAASLR